MADARFYESLGPLRLADLAQLTGGRLHDSADAGRLIAGVAPLEAGRPDCVGYAESSKKAKQIAESRLGACFVAEADLPAATAHETALVIAKNPQESFVKAAYALVRPRRDDFGESGVHPSVRLGEGAVIESGARVAQDVKIGARTRIGPNAVIGGGVTIGPDGEIGPCAVVRFADLGARVRIHAGAAIGENGYGLAQGESELLERLHIGHVTIGDDVRIGASTTVDRGAFADTVIGDGAKIDNLVQIAHNVRIGRRCVIAGCCGISGSAVIEDGAMLGGSVGISDHVTIGAGAKLAGASLVMRDVPPGESWCGAPARPIRQFFREVVALERLARPSDRT